MIFRNYIFCEFVHLLMVNIPSCIFLLVLAPIEFHSMKYLWRPSIFHQTLLNVPVYETLHIPRLQHGDPILHSHLHRHHLHKTGTEMGGLLLNVDNNNTALVKCISLRGYKLLYLLSMRS